jgi:four helix bundle protein
MRDDHKLLAAEDKGTKREYKFEKLEVYRLALEYLDVTYQLAEELPRSEAFNLRDQVIRAGTSIVLNIAEGSTSQSDAEQGRFVGIALRSLIETVACQDIMLRRGYGGESQLEEAREFGHKLFAKLQAFHHSLQRRI